MTSRSQSVYTDDGAAVHARIDGEHLHLRIVEDGQLGSAPSTRARLTLAQARQLHQALGALVNAAAATEVYPS